MSPQQSIAHYRITAKLGEGGMGEVWRATDTKLSREVAIKILPEAFAADPDRMARFTREAQVLASLNHPNIAAIHGVEERALILELVEGSTLAERITTGSILLDEALPIAKQIAEALEYAHDRGVIHRDLKPANIKVTPEGKVKVLDFGIAAVAQASAPGPADPSSSPTLTMRATQMGVIMGTAAYMSPEQAAGKPVDKRSDIWSFGAVLWEMLMGKRLFEGETVSHTLADVLRAEIDFDKLPADTPATIRQLLRRCLDRDVKNRLRDIGEARVAIQCYLANPVSAPEAIVQKRQAWRLAIAASIGILAFIHFRDRPAVTDVLRFQFAPPEKTTYDEHVAVSPDGRRVIFSALGGDGVPRLWVHSFDSPDSHPLSGTEGVTLRSHSFWSWDSRFVAFQTGGYGGSGKLNRIDVSGGPPQTICSDLPGSLAGGFWSREGQIVLAVLAESRKGLLRVPASGGVASPLTTLDPAHGELDHVFPVLLPDEQHFIYHVSARPDHAGIYLGSLNGNSQALRGKRLLPDAEQAVFAPSLASGASRDSGYLLFVRGNTLMAQPFDAGRGTDWRPLPDRTKHSGSRGVRGIGEWRVSLSGGRPGKSPTHLVRPGRKGARGRRATGC
jgi:serine/threonine-protein kinase